MRLKILTLLSVSLVARVESFFESAKKFERQILFHHWTATVSNAKVGNHILLVKLCFGKTSNSRRWESLRNLKNFLWKIKKVKSNNYLRNKILLFMFAYKKGKNDKSVINLFALLSNAQHETSLWLNLWSVCVWMKVFLHKFSLSVRKKETVQDMHKKTRHFSNTFKLFIVLFSKLVRAIFYFLGESFFFSFVYNWNMKIKCCENFRVA